MSDDKCKCSLRESMLGDGCKVCQPRTYIAKIEDALQSAESEIEQLEQELAEAKKDQARYLKLIETGNFCPTQYSGLWGLHMSGEPYTKAELDAPIDKAIAAIKESK